MEQQGASGRSVYGDLFKSTGAEGLDGALERLFNAIEERTAEQEAEAEARAQRAEENARQYQAELMHKHEGRKPADSVFVKAFDKAMAGAEGMPRSEATLHVARHTASHFVGSVDGLVVKHLAEVYTRHGSETVRAVGAELVRELAASPNKIAKPIAVLDWRCSKAMAKTG